MKIPFVSLQKMHQEISLEMKNKFSEIYDKNMFIQGQETALFETTSAGLHNWKNLAETIYNANLDRILVTDEIGYGIVPIDPFEREYREETGRICCLLAEKSEEVWRVCCGIGTRLK